MNIKPLIEIAQYEHFAAVLALNEAAIPAVNSISLTDLEQLAAQSCYFRVAIIEEKVLGFLLMLPPGASYKSLNYAWFSERYDDFAYVDRIVIDPAVVGKGIGRQFYNDAISVLAENHSRINCEVNIKPRNDASLAFHAALGFIEVGQRDTASGTKRVSLLSRVLK